MQISITDKNASQSTLERFESTWKLQAKNIKKTMFIWLTMSIVFVVVHLIDDGWNEFKTSGAEYRQIV